MESCRNEFVKQKLQEDYLDFIKKACETNKHISSKALIEKGMKAAKEAFIVNKNILASNDSSNVEVHQWNFKSVGDNFQAHPPAKAKEGFLVCNLLDS